VAVSVVAFVLVRTVLWSQSVAAEAAPVGRVVTRNRVTFNLPLPQRYSGDIGARGSELHLTRTTFASWFGGKDPAHDTDSFPCVALTECFFGVESEDLTRRIKRLATTCHEITQAMGTLRFPFYPAGMPLVLRSREARSRRADAVLARSGRRPVAD